MSRLELLFWAIVSTFVVCQLRGDTLRTALLICVGAGLGLFADWMVNAGETE